jgi:hypothetical protein
MTQQTQYTEEDLRDAMYTRLVDNDANCTQFSSLRDKIDCFEAGMTVLYLDDPEDRRYFNETVIPSGVEKYRRGESILQTCKILVSPRRVVLGDNTYDEMVAGETVVSPVIRQSSGYIRSVYRRRSQGNRVESF